MPITFQLDSDLRLLRFEVAGQWDTDEMLAVTHQAYAGMREHSDFDILSDNRRNTQAATAEQIRSLAELMNREGSMFVGRRAAVVVADQVGYGMIRMLAARAAPLGLDLRAFWTVDEAMQFLRPTEAAAPQ